MMTSVFGLSFRAFGCTGALPLLGMVGACLAFDVYDVTRWYRGERYRLGSQSAAALGASGAAPAPEHAGQVAGDPAYR